MNEMYVEHVLSVAMVYNVVTEHRDGMIHFR